MNLLNKKLDTSQFGAHCILVDIRPKYAYVNRQKTDVISGYRYTLVLPEMGYERIDVVIDGEARLEKPQQPVEVVLQGFGPYISWNKDTGLVFAAKATGISLVNKAKA